MKRKLLTIGIIFAILTILLGVAYAIIAPQLPVWTVTQMMDHLEELDIDELELELTELQRELFEVVLEIFLENLSYEIIDSRIEGRYAFVTMDLVVIDLTSFILDNYSIIIRNVVPNIASLIITALGGGIEEILIQELLNLLTDEAVELTLTTTQIEIPLERSGLLWIPIITDELLMSMIGIDDLSIGIRDIIDHFTN